jgi:hypothetical protein
MRSKTPLPAAALALACAALGACVATANMDARYEGYNFKLRPDRRPLEPEQLQANTFLETFGPYRFGPGDLVSPLVPDRGHPEHLPQSTCWWMAQAASGGGDAMRASWEGVMTIIGDEKVMDSFHDPEDDVLDIGLCRMNDPQTRVPPRGREAGDVFTDWDCSRWEDGVALTVSSQNNLPLCVQDTIWVDTTLEAYRTTATDPLRTCESIRAGFGVLDRRIGQGTDFFDGATNGRTDDAAEVTSCASFRTLIPPKPTRYRLVQSDNLFLWLEPALIPIASEQLGRLAESAGTNVWAWSTSVTPGIPSTDVRWGENFSASLTVVSVRLFDLGANGTRNYIDAQPRPQLCIEDRDLLAGCRWTCDASPGNELRYELTSGLCDNAQGVAEAPLVTPTYAKSTAENLRLQQPLRWSTTLARTQAPHFELTLASSFEPAALRAAPATDLGGARTGQYVRASFEVENMGSHPLRITAVAMDPAKGGNAPGDFTLQLPAEPLPEPLPLEITGKDKDESTFELGRDAESQSLLTLASDFAHYRLKRRTGNFSTRTGDHTVTNDRGILWRDAPNATSQFDSSRTPAARTSYRQRTLPFVIQPGTRFEVSVRARPGATGQRTGFARIAAESAIDPSQRLTIWSQVRATGMQGPLVSAAPSQLVVVAQGTGVARRRVVLIQNAGDTSVAVGAPRLTAVGGGPLPGDSQLVLDDPYGGAGTFASGDARDIAVEYLSDCSRNVVGGYRDEDAELRWTTPDGPIVVRIDTSASCP